MSAAPKKTRPQAAEPGARMKKQSSQRSVPNDLRGARVRASIWHDPEFLRLSGDAQRLVLMLWTAPDTHITGLVTLPPETMAARLRLSPRRVRALLIELQNADFVGFDDVNSLRPVFWLIGYYETQLGGEPRTDEHISNTGYHLDKLPSCETVRRFVLRYGVTAESIASARAELKRKRRETAAAWKSAKSAGGLAGGLPPKSGGLAGGLADPPLPYALSHKEGDDVQEVRRVC